MNVILLDNVENLGSIGDLVKVKPGYGRNFLLPQGKAALATPENIKAIDARRAALREAAMGVGASPVQVVFHHVVPMALPGILTGTILTIGRAFGETAPLLLVGAVTGGFAVYGVAPRRPTLEDVFVHLVEEKSDDE